MKNYSRSTQNARPKIDSLGPRPFCNSLAQFFLLTCHCGKISLDFRVDRMDGEKCEFLAGDESIEVRGAQKSSYEPSFLFSDNSEAECRRNSPDQRRCGSFRGWSRNASAFVAGSAAQKEALLHYCGSILKFDKKKRKTSVQTPNWLSPDELRRYLVAETENAGLTELPNYFFEIAHILVREAHEDLLESDLVSDIFCSINQFHQLKKMIFR